MPHQMELSSSVSWESSQHSSLLVIHFINIINILDLGSAYGTAKSGVGICAMGVTRPDLVLKSVVPVIMAGILGVYGLIVGVILQQKISSTNYSWFKGYSHLAAGLCCGLSSLAAGLAIGITGDAGVRANAHQSEIFVGMLLMLIFAEALGLYGLIISLILSQ